MKTILIALLLTAVADLRPTPESIARFLHQITGGRYAEGTVKGFAYADLDADGSEELVAWLDISGRGHGRLFVVTRTEKGFAQFSLPAHGVDFDDVIRDVDGNGKREIVLRKGITPYGGGHARAELAQVFAWTGTDLEDRSSEHRAFYESVELPRVIAALAHARTLQGEGDVAAADALEIERDKILRLTGADASAGLVRALEWAADETPRRREWAAVVLGEIATPEAKRVLERLAADGDRAVAETARNAAAKVTKE